MMNTEDFDTVALTQANGKKENFSLLDVLKSLKRIDEEIIDEYFPTYLNAEEIRFLKTILIMDEQIDLIKKKMRNINNPEERLETDKDISDKVLTMRPSEIVSHINVSIKHGG